VGVAAAFGVAVVAVGDVVDVVVVVCDPSSSLIARPAPSSMAATTAPMAILSVGNPAVAHPARAAMTAAKNTSTACMLFDKPVELLILFSSIEDMLF
jgi:hypothetical protein